MRPIIQDRPKKWPKDESKDTAEFAARHRLGMGVAYLPFALLSQTIAYYREQCAQVGWQPTPDDILYRGAICIAQSEEEAQRIAAHALFKNLNVIMRGSINEAVARLDPAGMNLANMGEASMARFVGTPEMIVRQIADCKVQGGVGVIDFGFHIPGMAHEEVMSHMELFGTQVLPKMRDL